MSEQNQTDDDDDDYDDDDAGLFYLNFTNYFCFCCICGCKFSNYYRRSDYNLLREIFVIVVVVVK
jgi:hypothetical protein